MVGILSQDEVDALLQAVEEGDVEIAGEQSGNAAGVEVNDYSFRRPNLLTRDQLRLFTTLHEHFAVDGQSRLSLSLRATSDMRLVASDQLQYSEFVLSLPDLTHLLLLNCEPLGGLIIFEVGLSFIYSAVDVALGGDGGTPVEHRNLTEVESAIAKPVLDELVEDLTRCISRVTPCQLSVNRAESSPQYVHAMPADTPTMVLTFEVKLGEGSGVINICYPIPVVERLLSNTHGASESTFYPALPSESEHPWSSRDALMDIPIQLRAVLGSANLNVREIMSLQLGDVLVLDTPITSLLRMLAGPVPVFEGRPGRRHGNLGVKVTRQITPKQQAGKRT